MSIPQPAKTVGAPKVLRTKHPMESSNKKRKTFKGRDVDGFTSLEGNVDAFYKKKKTEENIPKTKEKPVKVPSKYK